MKKILEYNKFWNQRWFRFKEDKFIKRNLFYEIKKVLNKKYIKIISWIRRLGKTTIIRQLISELLNNWINSKSIFYYTFSKIDTDLENILNEYLKKIYVWDIQNDNIYIFLDELQYVENWQDIIKFWYDLYPNINFILTWSANLWMNKTEESLLGRFLDFKIEWLTFEEYLNFKWYWDYNTFSFGLEAEWLEKLMKDKYIYLDNFWEYLFKWEFPGLINEEDDFIYNFFTNSVLDIIFEKDILLFENVNSNMIKSIFKILLNNAWSFVSKQNIARELWISKHFINKYILLLEKVFLFDQINNFLKSPISQQKSYKKIYSRSVNLLISWMWFSSFDNIYHNNFKWQIIENYVYNKIKPLWDKVYYFNKKWVEVDFVLIKWNILFPIEVKIKNKIWKMDYSSIISFCKKNNLNKGYLFYSWDFKEIHTEGITIYCLHFWC